MSELTGDERNLVRDLLEEAEDKGYSRERFRAIVSAALDERETEAERREAILDYARDRGAASSRRRVAAANTATGAGNVAASRSQ